MSALAGHTPLLGLLELLQIAGFNHRTALLRLVDAGVDGWLALRDGQIIDAAAGDLRGEAALTPLLQAGEGRFELLPLAEDAEATIRLPLGQVLMRAAAALPPPELAPPVDATWAVEGPTDLFGLQEFLQVFESNRRPARVLFGGTAGTLDLVLADGGIVEATGPGGAGPEAVYAALRDAPEAVAVRAVPDLPTPEHLYDIASVLMEGLRRRDEAALVEDDAQPVENPHAEEMLEALERGELGPLERRELARRYLPGGATTPAPVLARLTVDPDEAVRATALESVEDLPGPVLHALVRDAETPGPLLGYLFADAPGAVDLRGALLENPALPAGAVARVGADLRADHLAAVGGRDDLLADAGLRAALRAHPHCGFTETLDRLDAAARPAKLKKIPFGAPPPARDRAEPAPPAEAEVVLAAPERDARVEKVEKRPTMADLLLMAMKGSLRERVRLTQHPMDTVAENVLSTPGIPDVAIEGIAANTSTNPVCFKQIAANPRWTKMTTVVQALVFNPKCPPSVSRGFVSLLNTGTLEKISSNRELPDALRQLARKRLERKH